jgi:hypothetical protein
MHTVDSVAAGRYLAPPIGVLDGESDAGGRVGIDYGIDAAAGDW